MKRLNENYDMDTHKCSITVFMSSSDTHHDPSRYFTLTKYDKSLWNAIVKPGYPTMHLCVCVKLLKKSLYSLFLLYVKHLIS